MTVTYDGDGNRATKTVAGVTTGYLFDEHNPTGYVQVLAPKTGKMSAGLEAIRGRISEFVEAFASMPVQQQNGITIAAGVAEDSSGSLRTLIGTSEPRGYIRAPMRGLIQPGDIIVKGTGHAEADIVSYSNAQGWRFIGVGATRNICPSCAAEIAAAGADAATPKD